MTSIVVEGQIDPGAHLREDGTPWPFALSKDNTSVFADTASGVIAYLVPGYPELSDPDGADDAHDEALILRWQSAVVTASDVQALMCTERTLEGLFSVENEPEESLTALFSDKTVALEGIGSWDHPVVPLVLVATDYEPFTERSLITGNVLWIDPSDEIAYLYSLANLGVIKLYVQDEE